MSLKDYQNLGIPNHADPILVNQQFQKIKDSYYNIMAEQYKSRQQSRSQSQIQQQSRSQQMIPRNTFPFIEESILSLNKEFDQFLNEQNTNTLNSDYQIYQKKVSNINGHVKAHARLNRNGQEIQQDYDSLRDGKQDYDDRLKIGNLQKGFQNNHPRIQEITNLPQTPPRINRKRV